MNEIQPKIFIIVSIADGDIQPIFRADASRCQLFIFFHYLAIL